MAAKRFSQKDFRWTIKGEFCVYCGEWAECLDHFPPYISTLSGFLLPACKECNSFAGTEFPYDFKLRARHVQEKIQQKYKRVLDTPEWSPAELRRLGYGLRVSIKAWKHLRAVVSVRVSWNAESYLAMLPAAKPFLRVVYDMDLAPENQKHSFEKHFSILTETEAA